MIVISKERFMSRSIFAGRNLSIYAWLRFITPTTPTRRDGDYK